MYFVIEVFDDCHRKCTQPKGETKANKNKLYMWAFLRYRQQVTNVY